VSSVGRKMNFTCYIDEFHVSKHLHFHDIKLDLALNNQNLLEKLRIN
jgi:hypothetical protein